MMLKTSSMKLLLFCFFILAFGSHINAQENFDLLPRFEYEVVSFPGEDFQNPITQVYVWVRNTHLQFVASDSVYLARYQINIGISDHKGVSVLTDDKTFMVTEQNYAATIDPKAQRAHRFDYRLSPAEYGFNIRLLDMSSNRSRSQERNKIVRAFEQNKLEVSDVLFVTASDTSTIQAAKVVSSFRIPIQEKIFVYAEVIGPENGGPIKIEATLKQKSGTEGFNFSQEIRPMLKITKVFLQVNKESMVRGENQLLIRVTSGGQSKVVRKDVLFVAGGESFDGVPVDDQIGPLMYVTDSDDWKKLSSASNQEKDSVLKVFWEKRDPSPGSPENELFNEFYKRVELTNRNFGYTRREGWRTDRGRVFIVFGAPDRVERTSPSSYRPGDYEVWYYDDLREKFVFYDEYGFGDYRLVSGNIRPAY